MIAYVMSIRLEPVLYTNPKLIYLAKGRLPDTYFFYLLALQRGCDSNFLLCNIQNATTQPCPAGDTNETVVHGGYITIEFARDVEMQSPEFLTTQENIAVFLDRDYNTPILVEDFGKPVCVVNTGHHDVVIPKITRSMFLSNVEWYLTLLNPQCESIIWIATTAPLSITAGKYFQTVNQTQSWNAGVKEILARTPKLLPKAVFVDVFEASRSWPHNDNIHMNDAWYAHLGRFINDVITTKC